MIRVEPIMILVTNGNSVHFHGMVFTLVPNGVEVAWINLSGVPKVVLSRGNSAFNRIDTQMVTFTELNNVGEAVLTLTGVMLFNQITECIVATDGCSSKFFGGKDVGQRDIRHCCEHFALRNWKLYNSGVY